MFQYLFLTYQHFTFPCSIQECSKSDRVSKYPVSWHLDANRLDTSYDGASVDTRPQLQPLIWSVGHNKPDYK